MTEGANHGERLIIFRKLLHGKRGLLGIAARIELYELQLVAADAAFRVDFVNCHVDSDPVCVGKAHIRAGLRHREPDDEIACIRATGPHEYGETRAKQQRPFHINPP